MSLEGTVTGQTLSGSINKCDVLTLSAYAIAVKNGFEGTEEEWLASLKGEKGEQGEKGEKGEIGVVDESGLILKDRTTGVKYKFYVDNGKLTMSESEG